MWQHFLSVLSTISLLVPVDVPLWNSRAHTGNLSCNVKLDVCEHVRGIVTWLRSTSCAIENQARAKILVYIYIYSIGLRQSAGPFEFPEQRSQSFGARLEVYQERSRDL